MQQHHVFLFRHCVRTTNARKALHNNWTAFVNEEEHLYEFEDYIGETKPNWKAFEFWCTREGLKTIEATGGHLFDRLLESLSPASISSSSRPTRIRIQIISDSVQRDVDTAFAMISGLKSRSNNQTANPTGVQLVGLEQLFFSTSLFKPWKMTDNDNRCADQAEYPDPALDDLIRQQVQERFNNISPPQLDFTQFVHLLEERGGPGKLGSLSDAPTWIPNSGEQFFGAPPIDTSSPFPLLVARGKREMAGPINLALWFGQTAFYSRVGGVLHPFLQNLTLEECYSMLEWNYWARSVLDMENSIVAANGAVMARAVLDALRDGRTYLTETSTPTTIPSEDYDATATIIVGHDGDIDSIATSLGLRWRLGKPFSSTSEANQKGQYVPTPPGSAMHFVRDLRNSQITMSFLFPVSLVAYDEGPGQKIPKGMMMDHSGRLEGTPLVLKPRTAVEDQIASSQFILSDDVSNMIIKSYGLDFLEMQLNATLQTFSYAQECHSLYMDKTEVFRNHYKSIQAKATGSAPRATELVGICLLFGFIFLALKRRRRAAPLTQNAYGGVPFEDKGVEIVGIQS